MPEYIVKMNQKVNKLTTLPPKKTYYPICATPI